MALFKVARRKFPSYFTKSRISGNPSIRRPRFPEIRISGYQDFRKSGRNLQQQPELNGERGEVIGQDGDPRRWCVRLFESSEIKKVIEFKFSSDLPKGDPVLALVEKQEAKL
jgi:hypothetical protein